jgi:hypothetical protein
MMVFVLLTGANLALIREIPLEAILVPTFWVFLGLIDLVIVWKLLLRRPVRAFHYTFLCVLIIAYLVLVYQVAMERFHPLGPLVRWYQQMPRTRVNSMAIQRFVHIGETWMALLMALALSAAAGSLASWLDRRRGWDVAACWRGALVGLGLFMVPATILHAVRGPDDQPETSRHWLRWGLLALFVVVGTWIGRSRLRSQS